MKFSEMTWRRQFSLNMYKSLKLPMAEMSFARDFTDTVRGNLYPLITKSEGATEHVGAGVYTLHSKNGYSERLFAALFPYATYKMTFASLLGSGGFVFAAEDTQVKIVVERDEWEASVVMTEGGVEQRAKLSPNFSDDFSLIVSLRPGHFDVYTEEDGSTVFAHSFSAESFKQSNRERFYKRAKVHTALSGNVSITSVSSYLDSGVGQADIRPFRYENGDIYTKDGRVFITFSTRLEMGGYQGILSWLPGTADFKLEGALFYDTGDGITYGDVATAIVYDRREEVWHLWQRSGGAGHIPAYATFKNDIRYGIHVIDVKPLEKLPEGAEDDTPFLGKKGDEDPDFMYDETRGKWLFAMCRITNKTKKYQYYFYESDRPDGGYEYVGEGPAGEETGGSIVKLDGKVYFVCGNSFSETSSYRVYEWGKFDTFEKLTCDYPDGGFRGWGTVMPIEVGTRRRFFWLTFDRTLRSSIGFNWSYGNLYCFEAEEYEKI